MFDILQTTTVSGEASPLKIRKPAISNDILEKPSTTGTVEVEND